ncbi:hypothetical protein CRYUN_Cryun24cG0054400 [Craigia yunnanensis]
MYVGLKSEYMWDKRNSDEILIQDIPGGPAAFEICAKFCYGMTVTLNAYNVVAARCAAEYLEIHCLDSIASKASIDTSKVEWSYTYNRKKLPSENGNSPQWNGVRKPQMIPKDWWVEDLCELHIDLYKRVITTIKTKGRVSVDVIGEALNAYALRRLPGFSKGMIQNNYFINSQTVPIENEFQESRSPKFGPDASKVLVAKLIDGYLAEIARDPNLSPSKFVNLAENIASFSRPSHDRLYHAIDMYLKEHPGISKSERKRICRVMDSRKLSTEACMHAVQNERLPLRVVVQVLFFEQVRTTASAGNSMPDLPGSITALVPGGFHGSSRSTTTNTEEDWDSVPAAEDIKALKRELATQRLGGSGSDRNGNGADKCDVEKVAANRMKGLVMSKIFSKLWSSKERHGKISSSDTSESPGSVNAEETKSTPSRSRRHSLS